MVKFSLIGSVTFLLATALQSRPFHRKMFNRILFFPSNSNSNLFSSHTLAWLHEHSLNYLVCLFLSYLSHAFIYILMKLVLLLFYLMYPLQAKQVTYKLKLQHKLTTKHQQSKSFYNSKSELLFLQKF